MKSCVYIADSDDSVANSIAFLLRSEGISSRVFSLGHDLLRTALDSPPECIVVESLLPDITGLNLMQRLRINRIATPVILLSQAMDSNSQVDALKVGVWDYLEKPFMQQQLVNSVQSAMTRTMMPA